MTKAICDSLIRMMIIMIIIMIIIKNKNENFLSSDTSVNLIYGPQFQNIHLAKTFSIINGELSSRYN